jgi:hypothetical protein
MSGGSVRPKKPHTPQTPPRPADAPEPAPTPSSKPELENDDSEAMPPDAGAAEAAEEKAEEKAKEQADDDGMPAKDAPVPKP